MKGHKNWLLLWGMIFLCLVSAGLTGCHGAKGTKAFEMPEPLMKKSSMKYHSGQKMTQIKYRRRFISRQFRILKNNIRI